MKVRIFNKHYHLVIYVGLPGIILLTGAFTLLYFLTPSLNIKEAKNRVRLCLKRELTQRHTEMLKKTGSRLPDHDMATKWQKEINRINNLKFLSVKIKRPFPDVLFGIESPTWVVRVDLLGEDMKRSVRYFWLSWAGIDREISRLAWYISI